MGDPRHISTLHSQILSWARICGLSLQLVGGVDTVGRGLGGGGSRHKLPGPEYFPYVVFLVSIIVDCTKSPLQAIQIHSAGDSRSPIWCKDFGLSALPGRPE